MVFIDHTQWLVDYYHSIILNQNDNLEKKKKCAIKIKQKLIIMNYAIMS